MQRTLSLALPALLVIAAAGCGATTEPQDGTFTLTSTDFDDGGILPEELRCERDGGLGLSPALEWSDAPEGTVGFALTMTHLPANAGPADPPNHYWLLWDIPAATNGLSRGNIEGIGIEGADKDGVGTGYSPPCAPADSAEQHEYTLTLMALSGRSDDLPTADDVTVDYDYLRSAVFPLILDEAILTVWN